MKTIRVFHTKSKFYPNFYSNLMKKETRIGDGTQMYNHIAYTKKGTKKYMKQISTKQYMKQISCNINHKAKKIP